jgi:probable rRNA maturation factor
MADIYLTDDRRISKLHGDFLGDARPTDVMSFPSGKRRGEIAISLDTAARQARERNIPLRWELTLLALHGILHLNGYDDRRLGAWKRMKTAEFESMVKLL